MIHHGAGYLMVSRISGDIEASSRSGDIVLMLPDPGPYSIDAKSKFGSVSSDFAGTTHRKRLVGEQFASANPPPSHRIYLRMGLGGITIKEVPSDSGSARRSGRSVGTPLCAMWEHPERQQA